MPNVREMLGDDLAKKAREYAKRVLDAFELGLDWGLVEIHRELNSNSDLYMATLGYLPTGIRRQWKEILEREKA